MAWKPIASCAAWPHPGGSLVAGTVVNGHIASPVRDARLDDVDLPMAQERMP